MAKKGRKRPEYKQTSVIAGTEPPSQKAWHTPSFSAEKPISPAYAEIDTDLARDNLENDLTAADLQDV